jgi:acyl-CoA synthetase (NDP forming)
MLKIALRDENVTFDIGTPGLFMSEVLTRLSREHADVVCVGDSPHGGLPAAKLACRRLRRHSSSIPIVVVQWGDEVHARREASALRAAGASAVHGTIEEARLALIALCAGRRSEPERPPWQGTSTPVS